MNIRKLCLLIGFISLAITGALLAFLFMPSVEGWLLAVLVILSGIFGLIAWGSFIAAISAKPGTVVQDGIISTILTLVF